MEIFESIRAILPEMVGVVALRVQLKCARGI